MQLNTKDSNALKWQKSNKRGGKTFNYKTLKEFQYRWEPQSITFTDSSECAYEPTVYDLGTPDVLSIPRFDYLYRKCQEQGIRCLAKHLVEFYEPEEGFDYIVKLVCNQEDTYFYRINVHPYGTEVKFGLAPIYGEVTQKKGEIWLTFNVKVDKFYREDNNEQQIN